nr:MAG TPA: hypothetical protein [Caudoviricetes sp.]
MLIEKADMLDAFVRNMLALGLFDAVDPPEDAKTMLAYVAGWIDMLDVMIREEEKKRDEKKALLEQLKQSCARVNAEGFCDTAEEIEEDLEKIAALDAEYEERWKCVGTGVCVKDTEVDNE